MLLARTRLGVFPGSLSTPRSTRNGITAAPCRDTISALLARCRRGVPILAAPSAFDDGEG